MFTTLPPTLTRARVHEAQGNGNTTFAMWQTWRYPSTIWVLAQNAEKMPVAPSLTFVRAKGDNILWAVEEALRGLPDALVVAQIDKALSLTIGRRLQLAAEAGGTTGLLLIRDGAGSPATQTRWQCMPLAGDSTLHNWSLIKNKSGTFGNWTVNWDGTSAAFDMVSTIGQRLCPAEKSG